MHWTTQKAHLKFSLTNTLGLFSTSVIVPFFSLVQLSNCDTMLWINSINVWLTGTPVIIAPCSSVRPHIGAINIVSSEPTPSISDHVEDKVVLRRWVNWSKLSPWLFALRSCSFPVKIFFDQLVTVAIKQVPIISTDWRSFCAALWSRGRATGSCTGLTPRAEKLTVFSFYEVSKIGDSKVCKEGGILKALIYTSGVTWTWLNISLNKT